MPECNEKQTNLITDVQSFDWLTKDYLENALQNYKKNKNLKIINMDIKPATSKGENYASVLTRIKIDFICDGVSEPQTGYYIIKTSFEGDEFAAEKLMSYDIYNREMDIYKIYIPKMNEILEELQENNDDQLFAETIYVDRDHSAIMFEDLSIKSYVLVDRLIGLDMTHAKMALRKLAKIHGASAVLNERESNVLTKYDRGMFNRYTDSFAPLFVNNLHACGERVSEWEEFKVYAEKLMKLKPYVMEYGKRVFDPKENHLNVLIHGDFWTNNVMFTYENQEPKDAKVIDFQYSCWGSPAVDLHYFFNTSLREELRLHHQDELLKYYYDILTDVLRGLNYKAKIPTLHEFWIQYMEKSFYAFTSACLIQPVMINTETEDADLHALLEDNERARNFKRVLYQNEKVQKNLKRLLPMFDRKGLIDIQDD